MPDTKITALTALTAADPANDVLPIVDVSDTTMAASGTTKKISINNVLGCSGTATLASATITGDLTVDTSTLKVDSANNRVGIGTATPGNLLSVRNEAASGIAYLDVRGGVGGAGVVQISGNGTTLGTTSFDLGQNSAGAFIYQRDALPLSIQINGSERYAISSSGVATWSNVGGVAGTAMTLNSTGLGVGAGPGLSGGSRRALTINSASGQLSILELAVNGSLTAYLYSNSSQTTLSSQGATFFSVETNNLERMRIKSTGQLRFVPLAADPAGAEAGDVYYNSTSNKLKCYNGTTWNDLF